MMSRTTRARASLAKSIVSFVLSSAAWIVADGTAKAAAISGCSSVLRAFSGIDAVNGGSAASMSTSKAMPA